MKNDIKVKWGRMAKDMSARDMKAWDVAAVDVSFRAALEECLFSDLSREEFQPVLIMYATLLVFALRDMNPWRNGARTWERNDSQNNSRHRVQ